MHFEKLYKIKNYYMIVMKKGELCQNSHVCPPDMVRSYFAFA